MDTTTQNQGSMWGVWRNMMYITLPQQEEYSLMTYTFSSNDPQWNSMAHTYRNRNCRTCGAETAYGRPYCATHNPNRRKCEYPDCGRPHAAHGLCQGHRAQQLKGQELHPIGKRGQRRERITGPGTGCEVREHDVLCWNPVHAKGMCKRHYYQERQARLGSKRKPTKAERQERDWDNGFEWKRTGF